MSVAAVNSKINTCSNEVASALLRATTSGAAGALAGRITQLISPIGGALFGVVSGVVSGVVLYATSRIIKAIDKQDFIDAITSCAIAIVGSIAALYAGHVAVNAVGIAFAWNQSRNLYKNIKLITLAGHFLLTIANIAYKAINQPSSPNNLQSQTAI